MRQTQPRSLWIWIGLASAMLLAGCGDDDGRRPANDFPQGSEPARLDPAEFTTEIDNRYWPMRPGDRWVYRESDGEGGVQRVVVTVTEKTRRIANGVEARVVHDAVSAGGTPVEITDDWYAQDAEGNLWVTVQVS